MGSSSARLRFRGQGAVVVSGRLRSDAPPERGIIGSVEHGLDNDAVLRSAENILARLRRSYLVLIASGAMLLVTYAFLLGPLFPWSPVKPGYERLRLVRADVYFGVGSSLDPAYGRVDQTIEITERFHQLNLRHRMTIIVCRDWADFHRFLPIVRGDGMGAATPEYGTVIFVTPKVQQIKFDTSEFIRHELSHAVLDQSSNLWKSLQFKKAPWLFKGVAVLAARQNTYGTWDDFVTRVRTESLAPLFSHETWKARGFDIRFAYSAWRYFLQWTIDIRGRPLFQKLLLGFMDRPAEAEQVFRDVYGEDLSIAVFQFDATVRAGSWAPTGVEVLR